MPIGKRELAAYLTLLNLGGETVSIEEARKILEILFPKKSIRSILRILLKSGFIDIDSERIVVKEPRKALETYLAGYILARIEKNMRSRHISYSVSKNHRESYIVSIKTERR